MTGTSVDGERRKQLVALLLQDAADRRRSVEGEIDVRAVMPGIRSELRK